MDLARASAAALEEIEDHILVVAAGHPIVGHGEMFQELCFAFQGRAIFFLLGEMNLTHYRWNLERSVQARRFYLRKLREQGGDDSVFTALSRTESLFAAIATDDLTSAQELRTLSSQSWMPDGEYEEDYCYYALVNAVAAGENDSAVQHFRQMATVLDGLQDARLAVCETFLENRQADFWLAFDEFVDELHERAVIAHDDGRLVGEPWLAAFQHVSIEAIGWLKLADAKGFQPPEPEYRMCPSVALRLSKGDQAPDIFLELESRFSL